jgi:hypothetical protein
MTNYLERLKAKGEGKRMPEAPSKGSKVQNGAPNQPFEPFEGGHERGVRRRETDADAVVFEETISEDARSVVVDAAARFLDRRKRNRV